MSFPAVYLFNGQQGSTVIQPSSPLITEERYREIQQAKERNDLKTDLLDPECNYRTGSYQTWRDITQNTSDRTNSSSSSQQQGSSQMTSDLHSLWQPSHPDRQQ